MKISFAGHANISLNDRVKELVEEQIRSNVGSTEPIVCYIGGYGDFDRICACVCRELKKEYESIEVVYVTPYVDLSAQAKIKEMYREGLCDTSIYPPIENTPPRLAIIKRNEWMMTNTDLVIAYVERSYGGAYNSLRVAKRRKKKIINIYEFIENEKPPTP